MKSFLMVVALLSPLITCDVTVPNEKYQRNNLPASDSLYCNDLNPQSHLDFAMLMGLWYGAEIITHHETEAYETYYDSCVVVHLSDTANENFGQDDYDYSSFDERQTDRRNQYGANNFNYNPSNLNNRRLRLVWDERGKTLEYQLRIDGSRRGFWVSSGLQKGTMLDLPYNQFTGTVQVMKAVGNHLVLTFCETLPKSQIFTIVLTRKPHMLSRDEVQSIRNLLRRRGLSVQSVRKVCKNDASSTAAVSIMTVISVVLATLSQKL